MSGFAAWVMSPAGTAILAMLALALGLVLGELDGIPRGRRHEAEDIEREEAEEEARVRAVAEAWRPADVPAMAQFDAIREAGRQAWKVQQERDASVELYPGRSLVPVGDDPTVTAWTQAMAAGMDAWLAEHVYGAPYSADELWSGQ